MFGTNLHTWWFWEQLSPLNLHMLPNSLEKFGFLSKAYMKILESNPKAHKKILGLPPKTSVPILHLSPSNKNHGFHHSYRDFWEYLQLLLYCLCFVTFIWMYSCLPTYKIHMKILYLSPTTPLPFIICSSQTKMLGPPLLIQRLLVTSSIITILPLFCHFHLNGAVFPH